MRRARVDNVVTAVLGGGQGARLWPLTQERAKPAVPVGGKFRLIDIPLSNSLHAGIERIYVLTQFNTASLHRHISQTYRFDLFSEGFVNILAAEQNLDNRDWYQGTADAVRHNLKRLSATDPEDVLILSGDQLYLMDLEAFVLAHRRGPQDGGGTADFTVAVKPVSPQEAPGLGIMKLDRSGRIVEFVEKPTDPRVIEDFTLDAETIDRLDLDAEPGTLLASMGIYVFRRDVMWELLEGTDQDDFGKEIIPHAIHDRRVMAFVHNGYWRDIGTIGAFHEANLELTDRIPALNLYSPERPVYTHPRFLPGSKVNRCDVSRSILCDGSIISESRITRGIVGVRAVVREGCDIARAVIMGATYFEDETEGRTPLGVGRGCVIENAILDLNSRVGDNCRLINEEGVDEADGDGWSIRNGVIVVHRGAEIPPGTVV
jgi:glucose-1-phosphate adenylyltransferase